MKKPKSKLLREETSFEKLKRLEQKPKTKRMSWQLAEANLEIMDNDMKKKFKKYAKEHNISTKEAVARGLHIINALQTEVVKEFGPKANIPLTFIGVKQPIRHHREKLMQDKKLKPKRESLLLALDYEYNTLRRINWAWGELGVTTYSPSRVQAVIDILNGKKPDRHSMHTIVHETMECLGEIKRPPKTHKNYDERKIAAIDLIKKRHGEAKITKDQAEVVKEDKITSKLYKKLPKLFPKQFS